jgi:hypothetical protein
MAWTGTESSIRGWNGGAAVRGALEQTRARLVGPGGYYNAGNAIGLTMGIVLQVGSVPDGGLGVQAAVGAMLDYLGGNAGAMALTAATAVFFWSGEAYHRAWANGAPPDEALNRRGDLLSAIGALVLGVALLSLGQVMLAATAGLLHAAGKFGSAWKWRPLPGWRPDWPDFYRSAVLASRVPALLAALIDLFDVVAAGGPSTALLTPLTLLVCYVLWSKADLMLFRSRPAEA